MLYVAERCFESGGRVWDHVRSGPVIGYRLVMCACWPSFAYSEPTDVQPHVLHGSLLMLKFFAATAVPGVCLLADRLRAVVSRLTPRAAPNTEPRQLVCTMEQCVCVSQSCRAQVFSNMIWILFILEFFTGAARAPGRMLVGFSVCGTKFMKELREFDA